jgi:gas vesicle protein
MKRKQGVTMNNFSNYNSHKDETQAIRWVTMMTVFWLALGLGVGAVMALLFAPTSGKKLRRNLSRGVEDRLDSGQEAIEPVVKRLEKEVGELRHTLEERIAKLR